MKSPRRSCDPFPNSEYETTDGRIIKEKSLFIRAKEKGEAMKRTRRSTKTLAAALERCRKAATALAVFMKRRYGVGTRLSWERHGVHIGSVVMAGYDGRVKVRNERTGKEFWINPSAILES